MSNLKGKVSLLLALVMMMMTVLPIVTVNAAEDVGTRRMMTATASYKGSTLADGTTLTVEKTETNRTISVKISDIKATSSNAASNPNLSKLVIYYSWDGNGLNTAASGKDNATITIPSFNAGTNHVLQIEGVINDNDGGYVGQSSVVTLYFKVPADKAATSVTTLTQKNNLLRNRNKIRLISFNKQWNGRNQCCLCLGRWRSKRNFRKQNNNHSSSYI